MRALLLAVVTITIAGADARPGDYKPIYILRNGDLTTKLPMMTKNDGVSKPSKKLIFIIDCVDMLRTLRCVVPGNCPPQALASGRNCPSGRICCRKDKPNPYLPLRLQTSLDMSLKGRALFDTKGKLSAGTLRRSELFDEDRIVFPTEIYSETYDEDQSSILTEFDEVEDREEGRTLLSSPKIGSSEVRRSVKYCMEYSKLTIDVGYASPLLKKLIPLRYEMENCDPSVSPLVVGGSNTSISEYPHMVALGYNRTSGLDYLCGGSLISDQFVLTAAHCTTTKWGPPVAVFMGASKLRPHKGTVASIKETYPHPGYRSTSCYNDIALIKLTQKVKLTSHLRPACLPTIKTAAQYPRNIAVATGWGKTGFAREPSENLQKVALKVMDNEKCGHYYKADKLTPMLHKGITPSMICATGYPNIGGDTCQGDSGGPLQSYLPDNRCMLQVVGVTSFGKSCGTGVPGVYTRVATYLSWIENIVWPQ